MKKTIRDYDLTSKKVIIRCDFNVPVTGNKITDNYRIVKSIPTINYAIDNDAKVIILSHFGKIKSKDDLAKYDLSIVLDELSSLLGREVLFSDKTRGQELEDMVNNLKDGEVLLIQNTRYEDLDDKLESSNDSELAKYWASLGDIFINDAFSCMHRAHASTAGISKFLPSGIGLLVEEELEKLDQLKADPERPYMVIMGGAKINDKIDVINSFSEISDYILVGGGMANTFLAASGIDVANSLVDEESLDFARDMLNKFSNKLVLPIDAIVFNKDRYRNTLVTDLKADDAIVDIGINSRKLFLTYLDKAKTVFWNGPLGVVEKEESSEGTLAILDGITKNNLSSVIGGGDIVSAATNMGYLDKVTFASTGGGASLDYLSNKELPALSVIMEKHEEKIQI